MKIGIILHSHTGNTLSVGEKLKEVLASQGHTVNLERVTAVNEDPNSKVKIVLENIPSVTGYDIVIFGAPVYGFSLSPVMNSYLSQLKDLKEKKVACFVTEHFPKPWMGGNHTIKQMVRIITPKGGKLAETGVVNWTNKAREEQIKELLERFCKAI